MKFSDALIAWFHKHRRPLPWRRAYRPYEVWVSEIMLQQTQVETMLPYFRLWMKMLPTVQTLARAEEPAVLKLWEGLGYYSRARNLHRAAKEIVEKHGGRFPSDYGAILELPGIGRYTAGAIASIAFEQDVPVVDGNVLRVLSRVYAIDDPVDEPAVRERFWSLASALLPAGRARDFNQGLMELGALVCRPRDPRCGHCPLKARCRAAAGGSPEAYPVKTPRRKMVRVDAAALVIEHEGRYFIRRRPEGSIMGGLWEFPEWKIARDEPLEEGAVRRRAAALAKKEFGLRGDFEELGTVRRNYTHHLETLRVFLAAGKPGKTPGAGWPTAWAAARDFSRYPFSSAHAKIAEILADRV